MSELSLVELRARWKALYHRPAPKLFRGKLLVGAVTQMRQDRHRMVETRERLGLHCT